MPAWAVVSALAFQLFLIVPAAAQSASDAEAHVFSAFTSSADPGVLAEKVRLGPALREQLGAADRGKVYEALVGRVSGRFFRVNAASGADAGTYAALAGGNPADPLVVLDAGEVALLLQYAPRERHVTFVEQLRGPAAELAPAPPKAEPVVERPLPTEAPAPTPVAAPSPPPTPPPPAPVVQSAPPVLPLEKPAPRVVQKPKPKPAAPKAAAPRVAEKPATTPAPTPTPKPAPVVAKARPRGECVIRPVMTDDDLYNCSAPTLPASYDSLPPPAAAPRPQQTAAPAPRPQAQCVIKPVMTDDELRACGAGR